VGVGAFAFFGRETGFVVSLPVRQGFLSPKISLQIVSEGAIFVTQLTVHRFLHF